MIFIFLLKVYLPDRTYKKIFHIWNILGKGLLICSDSCKELVIKISMKENKILEEFSLQTLIVWSDKAQEKNHSKVIGQ